MDFHDVKTIYDSLQYEDVPFGVSDCDDLGLSLNLTAKDFKFSFFLPNGNYRPF